MMVTKTKILLSSAVLLVMGVVVGSGSLPTAVASHAAQQTLHFDVQFHDTWLGPPALGTQLVLNDRLLSQGKQVGHDGGVCVITDADLPEALCTVTYALPKGTISAQFLNTPPSRKDFAITGGTGRYENARGHGELVENGDGPPGGGGGTGTVAFMLIG